MYYKTCNNKLLVIIKALKTNYYYLQIYKIKILLFINYNNLDYFINIKNLSS